MSDNSIDQELIYCGKEIVDLYTSTVNYDVKKIIIKSKKFFEILMYKFLGRRVACADFDKEKNAFYKRFDERVRVDGKNDVVHNEITLAIDRLNVYSRGSKIYKFGIAHNVRCVDWILHDIFGLTKESYFLDAYKSYLKSNKRFFSREKSEQLSGRERAFYRNAFRAEMYIHYMRNNVDDKPWCDLYTPIILTRMAMEQYIKHICNKHGLYDDKFNEDDFNLNFAINKIYKEGFIDEAFMQEMHCVRRRGNDNTHDAETAFLFANMQGIDLLVECYKRM